MVHALGWRWPDLFGPLRRSRIERARRQVRWSSDDFYGSACHRIEFRSVVPAVRRELQRHPADLVITPANRVGDDREGWRLQELVGTVSGPLLLVKDRVRHPPRRVVIITDHRDLVHDALPTALTVVGRLRTTELAADEGPLEVELVHVMRAEYEWSEARTALGHQLEPSLDAPDFIIRSVRPILVGHVGDVLRETPADIAVLFADVGGGVRRARMSRLAVALAARVATPLMLIPPAEAGHFSGEHGVCAVHPSRVGDGVAQPLAGPSIAKTRAGIR